MTDDNNNSEWEGQLHLPIHAVHQLREMVRYFIQTWPGAPARPAEEQENPNERGDNKT